MTDISLLEQILRRLNLLVLLELDKVTPRSGTTISGKVHRLIGLGLQPAEVASVVGKPVNYVTAITSSAKKALKEKRDG
jgi:hypothetical protein